jgi:hypothetical protein
LHNRFRRLQRQATEELPYTNGLASEDQGLRVRNRGVVKKVHLADQLLGEKRGIKE